MKKIYIIAFACILSFISSEISVRAQEQAPRIIIMGVPQYIIQHGIRIDLDIPVRNHKGWWVVSPQYYINVSNLNNINDNDFNQMHGYGLSLYRKGFLTGKYPDQGVYIAGGLGYQHFNILTSQNRWAQIEEDGLKYMQIVNDDYHIYINKVLTEVIIGYQKEITSRLYMDIFVGFGLRYSFHDQPSGSDIKFNKNVFDYGYTGTAFIGGFRIGVGI